MLSLKSTVLHFEIPIAGSHEVTESLDMTCLADEIRIEKKILKDHTMVPR